MAGVNITNSALTTFMHMAGNCRWVSRRTLYLYLNNDNWRGSVIKKMQDDDLLSCKRLSGGWRYKLTEKGYDWLSRSNPKRFSDKEQCIVADSEYAEDKIRRISLLGESHVMSELAGYSAHMDDKPAAGVISPFLTPASRPAFSASATNSNTEPTIKSANDIHNIIRYRYYHEDERQKRGPLYLDTREYRKRTTPIGCYYSVRELKALAEREIEIKGEDTTGELDAVSKYSKLSGVLFTGGGAYRIFNTESTAPKLRPKGEKAMKTLAETWCGHVYKRSLESVYSGYLDGYVRGSVLFGDKSHQAAVNIISETSRRAFELNKKKREDEIVAGRVFNLQDIPDVFYIPVIREALPLYAYMIFPHWEKDMRIIGMDYLSYIEGPGIAADYGNGGYLDGRLSDGREFAVLIALDLRRVMKIVGEINENTAGVHIVCMEWQKPFFEKLLEIMDADKASKMSFEFIPSQVLFSCLNQKQEETGYDGVF